MLIYLSSFNHLLYNFEVYKSWDLMPYSKPLSILFKNIFIFRRSIMQNNYYASINDNSDTWLKIRWSTILQLSKTISQAHQLRKLKVATMPSLSLAALHIVLVCWLPLCLLPFRPPPSLEGLCRPSPMPLLCSDQWGPWHRDRPKGKHHRPQRR